MSYNPFLNPFFEDLSIGPQDVPLPPSSAYSDPPSEAAAMYPGIAPVEMPPHRHAPAPHVVLPPFRASRPAAWFGQAENIFRLRGVTDQRDKFAYAVAVLGEDQTLAIDDLLEQYPPPRDVFDRLRARLLASHSLDTFQLAEQLFDMQPLGGQRPSVLLAQMRQLLPPGEENSVLFRCLFLRRLPREIRLALAEDRFSPVAALAARADRLVVHHDPAVAAVAAVVDPVVAAATAGGRPLQQPKKGEKKNGDKRCRKPRVGVCYSHWKYGDDAYHCDQPGACAFRPEN